MKFYPNSPSTDQSIKIQLGQPAEVSVQLYDQQGRLVENVYSGYVYAGEIVVNSGIEHLPTGMYIYQVMIGEELKYVKFIKQ
ncbi:MAG: T9SS type A sorting domain-containing protein [Crocinitomicaceae bacterium]|nr:T9SS type A sorting domain-containing protein [Crocinitomicaceae bacterium]